jgi:hypothetical protein
MVFNFVQLTLSRSGEFVYCMFGPIAVQRIILLSRQTGRYISNKIVHTYATSLNTQIVVAADTIFTLIAFLTLHPKFLMFCALSNM